MYGSNNGFNYESYIGGKQIILELDNEKHWWFLLPLYTSWNIELIKKKHKFSSLPENLQEIANLRIENPDVSLIELGKLLKEPIGKSGVNHRLKRISAIAEDLRFQK